MPVYKNEKNGTWYAMVRYQDWTGENKQKCQRGFATRRDAVEWETQFKLQKSADIDMTLESFYELYEKDIRPRLKENTWMTKQVIYEKKILPYLGKRKLSEITAKDVIDWQNEMMMLKKPNGEPLSPCYLKTIHAELSALFNHAAKYYQLGINPARNAGCMGREDVKEMLFWTKEEYLTFAEAIMDRPISYYAFELLYWCGIREGELLALTPADFDFEKRTLRINKSYQRLHGEDVVTTPKTKKSIRVIKLSNFLCEEMKDCLKMFYDIKPTDRIFQSLSKHSLFTEMDRGCKLTGLKRIRIHDLRHSHISFLINTGFTALDIGNRVGHESEKITYRYAHLFPTRQEQMAEFLENERGIKKED
ncbi:MAG: tyrosine-type recombinase/integrase [Pseudobutyrivibrio sp.]|nr:tyrosine-type recombinase/integrase [Pseudobutyrivibrio sp.]